METLILNSNSEEDVRLLLDIAKKMGMDLKVADRKDLFLTEAKLLNRSIKPNNISLSEIVDSCNSVRKARHEKSQKNNS